MDQQALTRKDQSQFAETVIMNLLDAHVSNINSERQAIWQRYTAMVVANAILLGIFSRESAPTALQIHFASGFGLALCMAWLISTVSGFRTFFMRLDAWNHFFWSQLGGIGEYANPFHIDIDLARGPRGRWIARMAVFVIVLFMLAYAFVLAHHLYYTMIFFEGPR